MQRTGNVSTVGLLLALMTRGGDSRFVTVPHEPTAKDSRSLVDIEVPFARDRFDMKRSTPLGRRVKIKIPEGITAKVIAKQLEITNPTRNKPIIVKSCDGVKFSIKDAHIFMEADTSDRRQGLADAAMMNLSLTEKDVLAALTYVKGKPDPLDSGVITTTATPPASEAVVADLHAAE